MPPRLLVRRRARSPSCPSAARRRRWRWSHHGHLGRIAVAAGAVFFLTKKDPAPAPVPEPPAAATSAATPTPPATEEVKPPEPAPSAAAPAEPVSAAPSAAPAPSAAVTAAVKPTPPLSLHPRRSPAPVPAAPKAPKAPKPRGRGSSARRASTRSTGGAQTGPRRQPHPRSPSRLSLHRHRNPPRRNPSPPNRRATIRTDTELSGPTSPGQSGADARVGTTLADRYRIDALIGEGGMGRVYSAEHVLMRKRLAIKVLHRELTTMAEVVARFEREGHGGPRTSTTRTCGPRPTSASWRTAPYFSCSNTCRARACATKSRSGPSPRSARCTSARQIAAGLGSAHALDIVHRDLKPENVMLVEKGGDPDFVKVLDFGIAKVPNR